MPHDALPHSKRQRSSSLESRRVLGPDEVLDPHVDWQEEVVRSSQRAHDKVEDKPEGVGAPAARDLLLRPHVQR